MKKDFRLDLGIRTITGLVIFILACGIAGISIFIPSTSDLKALLLNLSTEGIGISITIAIVDWIFEKRTDKENNLRIANELLGRIEYISWVWLGGSRYPNPALTLKLLQNISNQDDLSPITANLILDLANEANRYTTQYTQQISKEADLTDAIHELSQLLNLRSSDGGVLLPAIIGEYFELSVTRLCDYLNIDTGEIPDNVPFDHLKFDSDVDLQIWRATGITPYTPNIKD